MSNIKYFGFARQSASLPIYSMNLQSFSEENIKGEVGKVLMTIKNLALSANERQKISSAFGIWFCIRDQQGIVYFALCTSNYPERHIYAAIEKLKVHFLQLGDYSTESDMVLKQHSKSVLTQICKKYEDLKQIDKIGQANNTINELKNTLAENTTKLINNSLNLSQLQKQSEALKDNAAQFEASGKQLKKQMWCRNCKLTIIIIVAVIILICVIVIPIVTTLKK